MAAYGFLLGLLNLTISGLCLLWWGADQTGSGAPAIVGVLSFNLAMTWLALAGLRRNAAGERTWSSRPALRSIGLALFLGAAAIVQGALNERRSGSSSISR